MHFYQYRCVALRSHFYDWVGDSHLTQSFSGASEHLQFERRFHVLYQVSIPADRNGSGPDPKNVK